MNRRVLLLIVVCLVVIYRCFNSNDESSKQESVKKVLKLADSFNGVTYKAGGTTKKGMDCSGLVTVCFKSIDISLPRSSQGMSAIGDKITLSKVEKGDLLFFNIDRLKGKINHVGLVTAVKPEILFIHSTTSKGVIYSSMEEEYWKISFVIAKRVITR